MFDFAENTFSNLNNETINYLYSTARRAGYLIIPILTLLLASPFFGYRLGNANAPLTTNKRHEHPTTNYLTITTLIIFFCLVIYVITYGEEFVGLDIHQLTLFSLDGKPWPMPIWAGQGRYWPLGLQEYNLIAAIDESMYAYQAMTIIEVLIIFYIVYRIFENTKPLLIVLVIATIFTNPSLVGPLLWLVYPERNIIFLLAVFVYLMAIEDKHRNKSIITLTLMLTVSQLMIHLKEPVFLLLAGVALSRIGIRLWNQYLTEKKIKYSEILTKSYTEISLLALTVIYAITYVTITSNKTKTSYAENLAQTGHLETLTYYLTNNYVTATLLIFFVAVIYNKLKYKIEIDSYWDSLPLGAIIYFAVYIKLNLTAKYYLAPVDFIAALYIFWYASQIKTNKRILIGVTAMIFVVLLGKNIIDTSSTILDHKKSIESYSKTQQFISTLSTKGDKDQDIQIYSTNSGQTIMEFAAFLHHKGLNVTTNNNTRHPTPKINFFVDAHGPENRCVNWVSQIQCTKPNINQQDYILRIPEIIASKTITGINTSIRLDNYISIYTHSPTYNSFEKILLFFARIGGYEHNSYSSYILKKVATD